MQVISFDGNGWSAADMPAEEAKLRVVDDKLTWIRAGGVEPTELTEMANHFELHPLSVEDVQSERQRPKVEAYDKMTFVALRVPRPQGTQLTWQSVGIFLGPDFLITASTSPMPELDELCDRITRHGMPPGRQHIDGLFHAVVDGLVDTWFPFLDQLEEGIDIIEDEVHDHADPATLATIRHMKRTVSKTKKVSGPMREAILALERVEHPNIGDTARLYLRDVSDHMVRITERLEHVQEMALISQEGWNSTLANSQNQQMKRLTVLFALFLVPTFLAGLGGMNFANFPDWPYWPVTGAILGIVAVGFVVSVWKKWL